MKFEIEALGEFPASDEEATLLERYSTQLPHYSSKQLLTMLYIVRCVEFAAWSKDVRIKGRHVQAIDILTAAPLMAASVFGEDGKQWLRALDLGSSAEVGRAVFGLIADGVMKLGGQDSIEDFDIHSPLDDFMKAQTE